MPAPATSDKPSVLFVNYREQRCGVHQYGRNVFEAISTSGRYRFNYEDVSDLEELDSCINRTHYDAIIYNYHPQTLSFITPEMPRRYQPASIAVMHEMTQAEADSMPSRFFQYYVMADPTLTENNPAVFKTGRLIIPYTNTQKTPDVVTIGTFGFSVDSKGYQRVVERVQEEFDEAIIRIHIPSNGIIDATGSAALQQIEECRRRLKKPGIQIQASHKFLDREAMLDFLAGNTLNAFLYDYLKVAGISSSPEHAIAVRRPIAITKSIMFRHLWSLYPPIAIEDASLREIISHGTKPFDHLYELWTSDNLRREYENILDRVLDQSSVNGFIARTSPHDPQVNEIGDFDYRGISRRYQSRRAALRRRKDSLRSEVVKRMLKRPAISRMLQPRGVKRFNRILDNQARRQYKSAITQLSLLAPAIMVSKIPAANIQQAFVFDTVKTFADQFADPRMLCVGSFDDSASASLKQLGYPIEEIDPEVNGLDLNTFFHLPSTSQESYDVIFSTSVIEHVEDDELFMRQIAALLKPGGVGILTCDYNDMRRPGDVEIPGIQRFYSQRDLVSRIVPALENCSLVDVPHWECAQPDFMYLGYRYTFASIVFRKNLN